METEHGHHPSLDLHQVNLVNKAHQDAGDSDPQNQEDDEVVREKGDVADLRIDHPSYKKVRQGKKDDHISDIEDGKESLENPVEPLKGEYKGRNRLKKEPRVSQKNNQQGPMEGHRPQPEISARLEQKLLRLLELDLVVLEQGTEQKDVNGQSRYDASCGIRAVNIVGFDPGERFLLTTDRGDMERDRRTGPFQDTVDKSYDEENHGAIGNNHSEQGIPFHPPYSDQNEKEEHNDCKNGIESVPVSHPNPFPSVISLLGNRFFPAFLRPSPYQPWLC